MAKTAIEAMRNALNETVIDGVATTIPFHHRILSESRFRSGNYDVSLVETLDQPFDRIIHNAGINRGPREKIMAVNAEAPIRVVQTLLDAGRLRQGGVVAIMTSQMRLPFSAVALVGSPITPLREILLVCACQGTPRCEVKSR